MADAQVDLARERTREVTANFGDDYWRQADLERAYPQEFVDALLASVAIMVAALSLPPVSRAYARDPWRVSIAVAAIALVPRFVILAVADGTIRGIAPTVFWLFATGVALAPGINFAPDGVGDPALDGSRFVRFSFAGSAADIVAGMDHLAAYVGR